MERWKGAGDVPGGSGGIGRLSDRGLGMGLAWEATGLRASWEAQAGSTGHLEFDQTAPSLLRSSMPDLLKRVSLQPEDTRQIDSWPGLTSVFVSWVFLP